MQSTANLWDVLCRDLEAERRGSSGEKHRETAQKFRETAFQLFRPESPRLCDALEITGDVNHAAGFMDEAVANFEDSLERNIASGRIAQACRVATKLAFAFDGTGQVERARSAYLRALDLFASARDYTQHLMLLSNLAALEKRAGLRDEAIGHYNEAFDIARRLHGEEHHEFATACNNLGVALTEAREWTNAENAHLRALGIREKLFGAMHPEVAQSLANLAVVYHSSGKTAKAEAFYTAAMKTYLAFLPPDDPAVVHVRENHELLRKSQP